MNNRIPNDPIDYENCAVPIDLTKGKIAFVDYEDFYKINDMGKWHIMLDGNKTYGYAVRHSKSIDGKRKIIKMERIITNCPDDMMVDHINGDTLDNRKCNLRICTRTENNRNKSKQKNNTSGYKGVEKRKNRIKNPYVAYIRVDGKKHQIGIFSNAYDAAKAYDRAAIVLHGVFSKLNFPESK